MTRALLLPLFVLATCGGDDTEKSTPSSQSPQFVAQTPEEAKQRAMKATGALLGKLVKRLTDELHVKEPHEALDVCSAEAQGITQAIREQEGIDLRRTALRYRNPKNKPDDYERAWMEKALKRTDVNPAGESEVLATSDGGRELRYIRPLYLAPLCTECHGPQDGLSPQVIAALKQRYPDDRATGFIPGELRGIVSVRVPLAK